VKDECHHLSLCLFDWKHIFIYLCFSSMCVDTWIYSRTMPWYFLHVKTLLLVNLVVCGSAGCGKLVIF
jgi:hypothetical protein